MNEKVKSNGMVIKPWPDSDGDLEIEFYNGHELNIYATGWVGRADVLTLVKESIRNFKITEDELNDTAK